MLSPNFLLKLKKNYKIVILMLLVTIIFCLMYPYKRMSSYSVVESMVGTEDATKQPSTNDTSSPKTGITVPVPSFNVPNGLKLPEQKQVVETTKESCPPCPPCARCPEPSFECKKVPKYRNLLINDQNQMVSPMVADYTTFGM